MDISSGIQNMGHNNNIQMPNKRIIFLDYARSIALFLVVFAHLYDSHTKVALFIYAFHMPLFFLISGYLHKDTYLDVLIKKLAKKLLIPFVFYIILGYLYCVISSFGSYLDIITRSTKGIIIGKSITANPMLWFLLALFWVRILGTIIIKKPIVFGVAFIIFFVIINRFGINYFFIGSATMAIPFYLIGYYGKELINKLISNRRGIIISFSLLISTIVISLINGKVSMIGMKYGNTPYFATNMALFYLNGLIGTMMILCISHTITYESRIMKIFAYCSLSIVGIQDIPIRIWLRSIGYNASFPLTLFYSIFIMFICTLFHLIVEKHAKLILGSNK